MTITPQSSLIATSSPLSLKEAEDGLRKSLTPMSLGQLQPLLESLDNFTKKENFNLSEDAVDKKLKQAESISRIFFSVVKEKGLIPELERDSHWKPWRENVEWVRTQIASIQQEEQEFFEPIFPITWH